MTCCGGFPPGRFSAVPAAHYPVVEPPLPPLPGERLTGYMIYDPPRAWVVPPCERNMTALGWLQVILATLFFWPAACVPCFCGCNYDGFQHPVYA